MKGSVKPFPESHQGEQGRREHRIQGRKEYQQTLQWQALRPQPWKIRTEEKRFGTGELPGLQQAQQPSNGVLRRQNYLRCSNKRARRQKTAEPGHAQGRAWPFQV
ncbi:hypothetical protein NDU88_001998 [Pleurodeles waltl]|uniref:Uncharacterized protein n=1 Tax=Pleurodeles waltl TaxID=8319 RepID=A0AAV7UYB0_PLEWA|nr:hypothetical protein NDU88_001998 [Pleurodeles waltl]